ncbi:glycerol kinase GlpK [Spirosoma taeanense]|uniref:ATP:glycerol 3-phosphotransferase n=1 Tax=Spirosoma taeanense TaxID=2735870 RepID=A0A6M5YDD0_9BACT|nr:glycerol kinase GlpK [Spirosoma taeanense]QJW91281.1 glycerol kinase GlpK [Spirosoma taeanense]
MKPPFILAIDQGTSSTKTLIFDADGQVVVRASEPLKTHYYGDGYVEQDSEEIYRNVLTSVGKCLGGFAAMGGKPHDIMVAGISNQRETFVVWNGAGEPLYKAIVWQCKRSISVCERLKAQGLEPTIRAKTGLFIDPYFSGTKLIWLAEHIENVSQAIRDGNAFFGTVDSWLLYKLTGGASYYTDYTNASRTLFFNLQTLTWDTELLNTFGLSGLNLPEPKPSSAYFGESCFNGLFDHPVRLSAMIGDSHAAAFGEGCFAPGTAKATLGTGCSIIMNVGPEPKESSHGMVSTICWSMEDRSGQRLVDYALEGVIVTCGATIEWLKNSLELIAHSTETEALAQSVADNGGVYLVPAFSGLGAPYWQMERKASISGITFSTTKAHLVRAALESIPYQIKDIVVAMEGDTGVSLAELAVNGGLTTNGFVLQFLADLLGKLVINQGMPDVSAQGAAFLAGLKEGIFRDLAHLEALTAQRNTLRPGAGASQTVVYYEGWQNAIRTKS